MSNPTPTEIRAARSNAGLTQADSAKLIYVSMRAWQDWEAGKRKMSKALFSLYLIMTKQAK